MILQATLMAMAINTATNSYTTNTAINETNSCYSVEQEYVGSEDYYDDLETLACLVWAEARGEDMTGKRYVVDVVLNRVDDPQFPNTIHDVIYQSGQFGPVTNGSLRAAYSNVTDDCYEAVKLELNQRLDSEILYFTAGCYGSGTPAFKYGHHYFGY